MHRACRKKMCEGSKKCTPCWVDIQDKTDMNIICT